jgi:magnesium-transporting ATPase (P-type)
VNKFSVLGYRTLFIAMKILSEEEYNKFASDLKEAQMSLENKDEKVAKVYESIEQNLILLGATIVEDKLQDFVPETIRDLRLAKIKVWMLTGDKMNTAYNIGLSCNLISKKMKTFNIMGQEKKVNTDLEDINKKEREQIILDFAKEFQGFKNEFNSMEKPSFGILVDEKALLTISEDDQIQKIFLEIAKEAETVICCRVSPLQKSQVVKMMKNYDTNGITLAIGDGGNDVPMIMEAHIGVGIYGEEGLRAVQSSDYAMGEFKFLRELLFSHGRMNNVKNSECIHYFFFKNFVETFGHFIFGFYNNFTGQTIIDDWFITLFNLLFTSLPLGTKAILDIDVCRDDGNIIYKILPSMYKENRDSPIFTLRKFSLNILKGLIYCITNNFLVI